MRLEAQAKAGFYPTPAEVVQILKTFIGEKKPGPKDCWIPVAAPASRQPR